MANQESSIAVIDNNVEVTAKKEDKSQTVTENVTSHDSDPAVSATSGDGHSAKVTVTEDAKATNTSGSATGVEAKSSDTNSSTSVTVGGEVSASAEKGSTTGIRATSETGGSSDVSVGGEVSASSVDGSSYGIQANSTKGSSTTVNAEMSVSATVTKGDSSATGLNVSASGTGSTTNVTVGDDVSATTSGYTATGVSATAGSGATVNVKIGDDLTVSSSGGSSGISANAIDEKSSVNVTVGGDVSATTTKNSGYNDFSALNASTSTDSSVSVTVGGNVTGNGGIYASGSGNTNINVTGNVSNTSEFGSALTTNTYGDSSSVNVTVGGDVTGNGGINASGYGKTDINVGGNVIGNGGIYAYGSGNTDINVGGNVTGNGGIYASGSGKTNINVTGNISNTSEFGSALTTNTYGDSSSVNVTVGGDVTGNGGIYASGSGKTDITVGGSVVQESQKSETQLTGSESSSGGIAITLSDGEHEGSETADVTVMVAENVIADTTAVNITKNSEESDIRLEVDGTISGGKHNIVLSEKSSLDNLDITVWRVDTSDGKNVVETLTYPTSEQEETKPKYTANLEAEKMINYIIKVDDVQTPGGNLGIAGASAGGVYTAQQNDTVYLEVTIPDGYTIDGFYNVDGAADVTVISGDGKYYLNVPRGGGVFVGVKMKKIESTATLDNTASASTSYSTYGSGDHRKSESNDQNWTVGNNPNDNSGNRTTLPPEFTGLQIHAMTMGGDAVQNLSDVLTFIDPLAALNNFMDKGIPTQGTQNVIGAGIVNFNNLFIASLTDTVDVPVTANVKANQSYTVLFSDGTSIVVPCIMDGLLTIPFNKNAAGLTYMIYGTDMNPGAFVGLTTSDWTP